MVGKNVDYVKINDGVVVIAEVSDKVACFFVSKTFEVLYKPCSEFFSLQCGEYGGEAVFLELGFCDVVCADIGEAVADGFEVLEEFSTCCGGEEVADGLLYLYGAF